MSEHETTQASEPLIGQAHEEAKAGYSPMPDSQRKKRTETFGGDAGGLREAAKEIVKDRKKDETIERSYRDADGQPVDPKETLSAERAARDLSAVRSKEAAEDEAQAAAQLAAEVDKAKAEAKADADADAEQSAEEPAPEAKSEAPKAFQLEEALKIPEVREGIEMRVRAAEDALLKYQTATNTALDMSKAVLFQQFPEIANAGANTLAVIEHMAKNNPARHAQLRAYLDSVVSIQAKQKEAVKVAEEERNRQFREFAKAQDEVFEKYTAAQPAEAVRNAASEILEIIRESGIDQAQFLEMFQTEPLMRHAAFQRMMFDAAQWRLAQKSLQARSTKPLPPVQRPGVARPSTSADQDKIARLESQFKANPSPKTAAALVSARRAEARNAR